MERIGGRLIGFAALAVSVGIAAAGCKDKGDGKSAGGGGEPAVELPTAVPADFSLTRSGGPIMADMGSWVAVTISSDGKGGYAQVRTERAPRDENGEEKELRSDPVPVPADTVLAIYQEVVRQKFFELDDEYDDPAVMDGGTINLTITADGKTKSVTLINVELPQVFAILDRLPKPPRAPVPRRNDPARDGLDELLAE